MLACYIVVCASRALFSIGKAHYEAEMSTASYAAIDSVINDISFGEFFDVVKNNNDDIVMITADAIKINGLSKKLAEECLKYYTNVCNSGVDVPLGAFSGIAFFSGLGKKININLLGVSSVKCQFESKFESVGINQTKQSLLLKIIPDCKVIAGFKKESIECEIEFICYENYIIGKVPQTYVNVTGFTASK